MVNSSIGVVDITQLCFYIEFSKERVPVLVKEFLSLQHIFLSHLNVLTNFPLELDGCSEGLDAFRLLF